MLWEAIVSVLAAFGFISLLRLLTDTMFCQAVRRETPVCAVVRTRGDPEQARQMVCAINRVCRKEHWDWRVVLIDDGEAPTRKELETMGKQDQSLFVCDACEREQAAARIVSDAREQ